MKLAYLWGLQLLPGALFGFASGLFAAPNSTSYGNRYQVNVNAAGLSFPTLQAYVPGCA